MEMLPVIACSKSTPSNTHSKESFIMNKCSKNINSIYLLI